MGTGIAINNNFKEILMPAPAKDDIMCNNIIKVSIQ